MAYRESRAARARLACYRVGPAGAHPCRLAVGGRMSTITSATLQALTARMHPRVVEWRRTIHRWPELAYQEHRTAELAAGVLRSLGAEVRTGLAGTGVVGIVRGRRPGKTIAVRADMDALPVEEQTGLPFVSENPGVSHACGHDSHVAMALGAAAVLAELRDSFDGQVMLIFEPNEETMDSQQEAGAYRLVPEGILDDPKVDLVLGQHVYAEYPAGQVALRAGPIMTGYDYIDLAILGTTA